MNPLNDTRVGLGYEISSHLRGPTGSLRNRVLTVLGNPQVSAAEIQSLPPILYIKIEVIISLFNNNRLHLVFNDDMPDPGKVSWHPTARAKFQQLRIKAKDDNTIKALNIIRRVIDEPTYREVKFSRERQLQKYIQTRKIPQIKNQVLRGARIDLNHLITAASRLTPPDFKFLLNSFIGEVYDSLILVDQLVNLNVANPETKENLEALLQLSFKKSAGGLNSTRDWFLQKIIENKAALGLDYRRNKKAIIQLLLKHGASPNSIESTHIRAGRKYSKHVSLLATCICNRKRSAHLRSRQFWFDVVDTFLKTSTLDKKNEVPFALEVALELQDADMVRLLGPHIKVHLFLTPTRKHEAVHQRWLEAKRQYTHTPNIEVLLHNKALWGRTPILMIRDAINEKNIEKATWIYTNINKNLLLDYGTSPYAYYMNEGKISDPILKVIKGALQRGGKAVSQWNLQTPGVYTSPLSIAASKGMDPLVSLLLKHQPPVNIEEGLVPPLHAATAGRCKPSTIKMLLDAGADPSTVDSKGNTALHVAASNRRATPETIQFLWNSGSLLSVKNKDGLTPVDYMIESHNTSIFQIVMEAVAATFKEGDTTNYCERILSSFNSDRFLEILLEVGIAAREAADEATPYTPLHTLATSHQISLRVSKTIDLLKRAGFDINAKAKVDKECIRKGDTAYHTAARMGNWNLMGAMLNAGIDESITDEEGLTGFQLYLAKVKKQQQKKTEASSSTPMADDDEEESGSKKQRKT